MISAWRTGRGTAAHVAGLARVAWGALGLLVLGCGAAEPERETGPDMGREPWAVVAPDPLLDPSEPIDAEASGNPRDCVESFDPEVDYFPDRVRVEHARQFSVEYHRHYKVVTIREPWQGADAGLRYLLVQCGTPRPEGFEGVESFEIPVRSVITTSTTEVPHLVRLGLVDQLIGHHEFDYIQSPPVRQRIDAGVMVEIGSGSTINLELVAASQPGLLLADSLGEGATGLLSKLSELGVPTALVPSFLETTALGRAEWIKFTALFFNRERVAEQGFAEVAGTYAELAARVAESVADQARPTVFTSAPLGDIWYMPGGQSFIARMLHDAGARFLWAEDTATGSLALPLESVYERVLDADFWVQPGTVASLDEIAAFDERFAATRAFREGRVFNSDARRNAHGASDYWEAGTARPDLVLADLIEIFHPDLLDHELVFHRRLPGVASQPQS
ncbi:MAG: ABC transporter substrate-binding protein [Acidobacteriota bacterium]